MHLHLISIALGPVTGVSSSSVNSHTGWSVCVPAGVCLPLEGEQGHTHCYMNRPSDIEHFCISLFGAVGKPYSEAAF